MGPWFCSLIWAGNPAVKATKLACCSCPVKMASNSSAIWIPAMPAMPAMPGWIPCLEARKEHLGVWEEHHLGTEKGSRWWPTCFLVSSMFRVGKLQKHSFMLLISALDSPKIAVLLQTLESLPVAYAKRCKSALIWFPLRHRTWQAHFNCLTARMWDSTISSTLLQIP